MYRNIIPELVPLILNTGLLLYDSFREEAELEYLRVAQDLEMLGVNYFDITVSILKLLQ